MELISLTVLALVGLTAASSTNNLTRRAASVYKVKNLTGPQLTGRWSAGYTDLGIPARTPDGRMIFVCGDTSKNNIGEFNTWRSPIGLYSSNSDLDSLTIDGCVGGSSCAGLVPEGHAAVNGGRTTAIPSDVFAANGKMYMNLMRGVIYKTDHTDFWVSSDSGNSWKYLFQWAGSQYNYQFQQKTCDTGDDGYIYCLATVFNRDRVSDLLLHRVPSGQIENQAAWVPWGYKNGAWGWGNPPTTIAPSRKWGEISWRNLGDGKWVFSWLNMEPLGIHYMVLNGPMDNLFAAQEKVLIFPAASLAAEHDNYVAHVYGGFIMPDSTVASADFAISQWIDNTYRVMQFRAKNL